MTGLLERMPLDRIMPAFFLKKNRRGSSDRIIILFFLLSVSILFLTYGRVEVLAGVYTISFLSVMGLFGISNILLKLLRKTLPRPKKASWISVFIAVLFVTIALAGNVIKEPEAGEPANLIIFLEYFIPTMLFVSIMLNKTALLKMVLSFVEYLFMPIAILVSKINRG